MDAAVVREREMYVYVREREEEEVLLPQSAVLYFVTSPPSV